MAPTAKAYWSWARLMWRSAPVGLCGALVLTALSGLGSWLLVVKSHARLQGQTAMLISWPLLVALMHLLLAMLFASSLVRVLKQSCLRLAPGVAHTARTMTLAAFAVAWIATQWPLLLVTLGGATVWAMLWPLFWSLGLCACAWALSLRFFVLQSHWSAPLLAIAAALLLPRFDWTTHLANLPAVARNQALPLLLLLLGACGLFWSWRAGQRALNVMVAPRRYTGAWITPPRTALAAARLSAHLPAANRRSTWPLLVYGPAPDWLATLKASAILGLVVYFLAQWVLHTLGRTSMDGVLMTVLIGPLFVLPMGLAPWSFQAAVSSRWLTLPGGLRRATAAHTVTRQLLRQGFVPTAVVSVASIAAAAWALDLPLTTALPLVLGALPLLLIHGLICAALLPVRWARDKRMLLAALLCVAAQVIAVLLAAWASGETSLLAPALLWLQVTLLCGLALLLYWLLPRLSAAKWARYDWAQAIRP